MVTPWLKKKTLELIGKEETYFINMILKKLKSRESAENVELQIEKILAEDAEVRITIFRIIC